VAPAVLGLGAGGSTGAWRSHSRRAYFTNEQSGSRFEEKCPSLDRPQRSASYSWPRLGCGYGASAASITRRLSESSGGGQRPQATNCVPAHAVLGAAEKARPSSIQAGPVIISASIRSRPAQPMNEANGNGAGRSDVLSLGPRRSGSEKQHEKISTDCDRCGLAASRNFARNFKIEMFVIRSGDWGAIDDAVRVELESIAFRDALKSK
jgi:hypothetical protein